MTADVFISYRGADRVLARKLENRLRSRWGSRVFRDESGLTAGLSWEQELADAMREARVTLALIGPGWEIGEDPDKEDWVRKELATALAGSKPILPVLVGNPDELRPKLASMPAAFKRQAVVVGPELAGFDLHCVASALRRLGAFSTDDAWSLTSRLDDIVPDTALQRAHKEVIDGNSLLVLGSSGSGRNALIRHMVERLREDGHLVASYGLSPWDRTHQTHELIAGWIESLSATFRDLSSQYYSRKAGEALVKAVLSAGPDLLSRQVVAARTLLPLGDTSYDQKILDAVRRPSDRWSPFPPTRLMHQSRGVLEVLHSTLKPFRKRPVLVVDHFDDIDSVSADLVQSLLEHPIGEGADAVGVVVAAYDAGPNARRTLRCMAGKAREEDPEINVACVNVEDVDAWGDSGNTLKPWLDTHSVKLAEPVANLLAGEANPYHALSRLWYLVDNGYVSEVRARASKSGEPNRGGVNHNGFVTWDSTGKGGDLPPVTEDQLFDHMVSEHIPVGLRRVVEAGALIGRTFPFHAACYAARPPVADGAVDDKLSSREVADWRLLAREIWDKLKRVDPDSSVIHCSESTHGELRVSLVQADLVAYLANCVEAKARKALHERIARYLVNPLESISGEDHGQRFARAELAARHWHLAERPRDAADAHRRAAEIAERSLAYRESKSNYLAAIRLYTQLLADMQDPAREHEDLLILSNCLYRVGQTTRLAGRPSRSSNRNRWGAMDFLEHALARLADLKTILLDVHSGRWPKGMTDPLLRDIPGPNLVRHYMRLYEALSGHINLELAQCHEAQVQACRSRAGDEFHTCTQCMAYDGQVRDRLFDALRNAEAAQGEGGSRWLLAAASARLAALLTEEALRARRSAPQRSHNLAVEAMFHVERVIGLRVTTEKERRDLADAVAWAWRSAGRLFRHQACDPRVALWAFEKMNDHGGNVEVVVDMVTDRWLGGFLLSTCDRGERSARLDRARYLLERYRDWAIQSGIVEARTASHLRLYLLELVSRSRLVKSEVRIEHLRRAWQHSATDSNRRDCQLFEALEIALSETNPERRSGAVLQKFRKALSGGETLSDAQAARAGWTLLTGMLVRRCPALADLVEELARPAVPELWADPDSELRYWVEWARQFMQAWRDTAAQHPCMDGGIERLARIRLPKPVFEHACETARIARRLLAVHEEACVAQEAVSVHMLEQDVEYAAYIHDWYVSVEPSRMLALASEWNVPISGAEWSKPQLLHGRLAVAVLKDMYSAETQLGKDRYDRIAGMVEHHCVGRTGASSLEKVFFLANALSETHHLNTLRDEPGQHKRDWRALALVPGALNRAYAAAMATKARAEWHAGNAVIPEVGEAGALQPQASSGPVKTVEDLEEAANAAQAEF